MKRSKAWWEATAAEAHDLQIRANRLTDKLGRADAIPEMLVHAGKMCELAGSVESGCHIERLSADKPKRKKRA